MADKTLKAQLIADDKMSAVFKKAGDSAKTLGDALEETGTAGKAAAKELDTAGKSADDLNRRLSDAYKGGQQLGIGLLGIAAASTVAGKSYRDQTIEIESLERSYGSASDQIESFIGKLEDSSNFSDEAARAAANQAATLARNYGFTADEVERVLQISADLAALSPNIGLEDATYRVTAALRGEGEAAEALGLTMNQQAIDRNNLTLTMSNEEAAHYRLNALIEQSAFAQGAAAAQSKDAYGSAIDLAQGIQDLGQRYGEALGPIGEFGALIADHPKEAIAAAAALKSLQVGLQGVISLYKATKGVNLADMLGGGAGAVPGVSKLVGLLTGPGGLVVAAGAAAVGIGLLGRHFTDDLPKASQASIDSMQELINKIVEAGDKSEYAVTLLQLDDVMTENKKVVDDFNSSLATLTHAQGELIDQGSVPIDADIFENLTQHQRELIDANGDLWISYDEVTAAAASWETQANSAAAVNEGLGNSLDELQTVWQMTGEAGQFAQSEAMAYTSALIAGQIGPERYEQLLQALITGYQNTGESALAAGAGVDSFAARIKAATQSTEGWMDAGGDVHKWLDDGLTRSLTELGQASVELGPKLETVDAVLLRVGATMASLSASNLDSLGGNVFDFLINGAKAAETFESAWLRVGGTLGGVVADDVSKLGQSIFDLIRSGGEAEDQAQKIAMSFRVVGSLANDIASSVAAFDLDKANADRAKADADDLSHAYENLRTTFTGTSDALSAGFQVVVGNTNAIAQQSQAVADWAENLIAAEGVYSKLDDLVNNHRITGTSGVFDDGSQYAQAQQAYNSILEDNAAIQEHVLTIQAKQAPMLADMEANLESYLGTLADATPEQQAFALAMMDSTTSAQAFDLATGLLENRDVFGPMAESLANLNPYLGEALVQMGLMDKVYNESTGTYEYHLKVDGGDEALSQTQQLTAAVEALNKTFTIAFGIQVDTGPLDDLKSKLNPFGSGSETSGTSGITVAVTADTSAATTAIGEVTSTEIPDKTAIVLGDNTGAMQSIGDVNSAAIDAKTLTIGGANGDAISAINEVNNMAVYDKYMTINVVTAYSTIGSPSGAGYLSERHGGIPGYAHGGIPVELAEGNRAELLSFANGGVMPIFQHGIYEVPPHTYVSPSNTGTAYGGPNITVDFSGAVFNNTDAEAMDRWAQERLVPALRRVIQDERRGQAS